MSRRQTITSLPAAPADDRHARMLKYGLAMGLRIICILLAFVLQGPWFWVCVAGAVILPWIAVTIANASLPKAGRPTRPGSIQRVHDYSSDRAA